MGIATNEAMIEAEWVTIDRELRDALVGLGWSRAVAATSVDEALGHVAHGAPIEAVIREALRRCPRPRAA